MGQPPPGSSPIAPAGAGNPGDVAMALSQLREAITMMSSILPKLQIGSPPYQFVAKTLEGAGKVVSPSDSIPGQQQTTLKGLQNQAQQSSVMQSLIRSMGTQGEPAGAPGGGGGVPA